MQTLTLSVLDNANILIMHMVGIVVKIIDIHCIRNRKNVCNVKVFGSSLKHMYICVHAHVVIHCATTV